MLVRSLVAILLLLAAPAAASAAPEAQLTIRGAGWGHGVGMSQYGAFGMAREGATYRQILAHYYTDTAIGTASTRTVRVLVASPTGTARFTGARRAGARRLNPRTTYGVRARRGSVDLLSPRGRRIATAPGMLRVAASRGGAVTLGGKGAYRGAFEFRPAGRGLNAINAVGLDDYIQGVVPLESPASWPLEALKAQSVAARSYALTTSKAGAGFEQYADTRSQVYGGVGAEAASTNEAVRQTRGEVVTYQGRPVVTFFFSTSGGRTEDVENTSLGNAPVPWLKSVPDPADRVSPKHRWGPLRMSLRQAGRKLGGLVKGSFEGIEVVSRGRSPRVVAADVVGTKGRVRTTGAVLRARLGLNDTWAYFTSVSTGEEEPPADEPDPEPTPPPGSANGGVAPAGAARAASTRTATRWLGGRVVRTARGGKAVLEIRTLVGWRAAGTTRIRRNGRYRFGLCAEGAYRVRVGSATGPVVHVR
jgi:stage II sporulation protein D